MRNIDTASLLDDFESEARIHIETIESAFLDIDALIHERALMDCVFRAAHSLKGTAGFFSLKKIVELAHELESVFSRIKDGELTVNEEMADVALQSIDCLKELLDHIHTPEMVETENVLALLDAYAAREQQPRTAGSTDLPFDMSKDETARTLTSAVKRGHWVYELHIGFNKELAKYYEDAKALIGDMLSVGLIAEAAVDGAPADASDGDRLAEWIMDRAAKQNNVSLRFLVTSVLEPELFLIAIELDERSVKVIAKETILDWLMPGEADAEDAPEPEESIDGAKDSQGRRKNPAKDTGQEEKPLLKLPGPKADLTIRLDVSVVNGLMDLANEMILTRNQLFSSVAGHTKSIVGLGPVLHDMNRLTGEMQEKVMRTRMQPISVIFGKFPRMIRDMAKSLHKDIRVEIMGGDTALDRYLLDALSDPIAQIVRNAAGHGIESAERREELGKPPKGLIQLRAHVRDGSAVIEISDDGAGINTSALMQKSLERGLVSTERLQVMTKQELLRLIFEPGLSTAKYITNLSGRGVGMDIVKTNIEKLGGTIEIESEEDKGTTMRLKMPLTLSVIRTLIVTIHEVQYAVPESNVERIVRISGATPSRRIERLNNSLVLNLNGWILPLATLEEIHAKENGAEPLCAQSLLGQIREKSVVKCLVLKSADRYFALLIDDASSTEETLVQPLPVYLRRCRCYASVMVLGSGHAITILDTEGIMRLLGIEGVPKESVEEKSEKAARPVIIFQCSGTEYFALDTGKIARIERIAPGQIQLVGNRQFVNLAGRTVQVVRPEEYVPVEKKNYKKDKLYLLVLHEKGFSAGFLAGRALNKVEEAFEMESGCLESDYIFGTGVYHEKILIFLDSDKIMKEVEASRQREKISHQIVPVEREG